MKVKLDELYRPVNLSSPRLCLATPRGRTPGRSSFPSLCRKAGENNSSRVTTLASSWVPQRQQCRTCRTTDDIRRQICPVRLSAGQIKLVPFVEYSDKHGCPKAIINLCQLFSPEPMPIVQASKEKITPCASLSHGGGIKFTATG